MTPSRSSVVPPIGLFLLAPLVAEYLLGNTSIAEIGGLFVLGPLYGGAAVLIREVSRHNGRGWPSIILLGAAFGLLQAGLVDQSLFNTTFGDNQLLADGWDVAYVAPLGISAYLTMIFIVGHAVWSIGVPIAVIEAPCGDRSTTPWLRVRGLIVTGIVYVLGSALLCYDQVRTEDFLVPGVKALGTLTVIALLVVAAFTIRPGTRPSPAWKPPEPRVVGGAALAATSVYIAMVPHWLGVVANVTWLGAGTVVITRWSRHPHWTPRHSLALASGAMLTYGWVSFTLAPFHDTPRSIDLGGDIAFTLGALALSVVADTKVRRTAHTTDRPRAEHALAPSRSEKLG